jgi:hypothetical protein
MLKLILLCAVATACHLRKPDRARFRMNLPDVRLLLAQRGMPTPPPPPTLDGVEQPPPTQAPDPEPRTDRAPRTAPARMARTKTPPPVTQTVARKQPSGSRSHGDCDGALPLPVADAKHLGADVRMGEMNRQTCYRCVDQGKTFVIHAPPPGFQHSCE